MQIGPCGATSAADRTDPLARSDLRTVDDAWGEIREVRKARLRPIRMLDLDHKPVVEIPAGKHHHPTGRRGDRCANRCAKIYARMRPAMPHTEA